MNKIKNSKNIIIVVSIRQATLTSNLVETKSPKNQEFHQQTGYQKGQEFEALRAFLSQPG